MEEVLQLLVACSVAAVFVCGYALGRSAPREAVMITTPSYPTYATDMMANGRFGQQCR